MTFEIFAVALCTPSHFPAPTHAVWQIDHHSQLTFCAKQKLKTLKKIIWSLSSSSVESVGIILAHEPTDENDLIAEGEIIGEGLEKQNVFLNQELWKI